MAREYKKELYRVDNFLDIEKYISDISEYMKFKKYFTDDGYDNMMKNRILGLYNRAALNGKFNIELDDIVFKKSFEDKTKRGYYYTAKLKIKHDNNKIEYVEEQGIIGFEKIDNEWKIYVDKITSPVPIIKTYLRSNAES